MSNIRSKIKFSRKRRLDSNKEHSLADYINRRDDYIHAWFMGEMEMRGMTNEQAWQFVEEVMEDAISFFEHDYPEATHDVISSIVIPKIDD